MDLIDLIETKRFLGAEFMMWLWFKSECYESLFDNRDHGTLELWFDDKLTLEAYLAETERNDFKGGAPAHSPEAKTALRQGKRMSKAKMGVIKEGREWTFTLKSDSLDVSGVKLPALLSREEDEQFYERMYLLEELEDIIASLYKEFLIIRLSSVWSDAMLPAMRTWVHADEPQQTSDYPEDACNAALTRALGKAPERSEEVAPEVAAALTASPTTTVSVEEQA